MARVKNFVYEMEKGWSFDGNFIPHFLELNWLWGESPVDYTGIQKVRIHGLSKGNAHLSVAMNSMEADQLDYEQYYTEPQLIDLPRNPKYVDHDFQSVTNYVDVASRGLSIQMKFEGSNKNILKPEPAHVVQVLILQSTPPGKRSN